MSRRTTTPAKTTLRCAIYTRKSTEEGLDSDFNTLDAQRESGEMYVAAQRHEGWTCLEERYDDGGYTGGNMDRPALRRLLADIEAGRVDVVVVYKVDRLSRSLLDFSRIMEVFERHGVSFVSVTQQFNTTHSMGRLTLNILLSFAQFEREIISERTRDKMAAARRKGRYAGGPPVLGYDVRETKLVVNEREAQRVRQIFRLYMEHEALLPVVRELEQRGWGTKRWTTRKGKARGGEPFVKTTLYHLLANVVYAGKVRHKDEVHPGLHEAVVDAATFERVQQLLRKNHHAGSAEGRRPGSLLGGLLHCVPCGCRMTHSHTAKGSRRYRYYVCTAAQKRGWEGCPSKSVPAGEIEWFVVEQIRGVGRDPDVVVETLAQARRQVEERTQTLNTERGHVERDLAQAHAEERALVSTGRTGERETARLAELQERIRRDERRLLEVCDDLARSRMDAVDEGEVRAVLARFEPVWTALTPREQARVLHLLVERVDYDGRDGTLAVTFRPTGIKSLSVEFAAGETAA